MEPIAITRGHALKIWWAFLWRSALLAISLGFVIGILVGIAAQLLGLGTETVRLLNLLAGLLLGIGISMEVMYRVLNKRYEDFEIALLQPREP